MAAGIVVPQISGGLGAQRTGANEPSTSPPGVAPSSLGAGKGGLAAEAAASDADIELRRCRVNAAGLIPRRCSSPSLQVSQGLLVDFLTGGYGYDQRSVKAALDLGNASFEQRQLRQAADYYAAAYELGRLVYVYPPLLHDLLLRRVLCHSMLGDLNSALREVDLAFEVLANSATAMLLKAVVLAKMQDTDNAMHWFQKAVAGAEELRDLVDCCVAFFSLEKGLVDHATGICNKVLARSPGEPLVLLLRGDSYVAHPSGYYKQEANDDYAVVLQQDRSLQLFCADPRSGAKPVVCGKDRIDELLLRFHPWLQVQGPVAYAAYPLCRQRRPLLVAAFVLYAIGKLRSFVRSSRLVRSVWKQREELLLQRAAAERRMQQLVEAQRKVAAVESHSQVWGPADPDHVLVRKYRRYWMERPLDFPLRGAKQLGDGGGSSSSSSARQPAWKASQPAGGASQALVRSSYGLPPPRKSVEAESAVNFLCGQNAASPGLQQQVWRQPFPTAPPPAPSAADGGALETAVPGSTWAAAAGPETTMAQLSQASAAVVAATRSASAALDGIPPPRLAFETPTTATPETTALSARRDMPGSEAASSPVLRSAGPGSRTFTGQLSEALLPGGSPSWDNASIACSAGQSTVPATPGHTGLQSLRTNQALSLSRQTSYEDRRPGALDVPEDRALDTAGPRPETIGAGWDEKQWAAKALELVGLFEEGAETLELGRIAQRPRPTSPISPRPPRSPAPPAAKLQGLLGEQVTNLVEAIEREGNFSVLPNWYKALDQIYEVSDMVACTKQPEPWVAAAQLTGAPGHSYVVPPKTPQPTRPCGRRGRTAKSLAASRSFEQDAGLRKTGHAQGDQIVAAGKAAVFAALADGAAGSQHGGDAGATAVKCGIGPAQSTELEALSCEQSVCGGPSPELSEEDIRRYQNKLLATSLPVGAPSPRSPEQTILSPREGSLSYS
eukprot:TRINITY_DN31525_c0_g1_i3.p1 TRINITY_DN31525_c0_g1~~TRINITY_DN31525_c0_g1_i3.p1  ORF type:complete len:955 (-),score=216.60 TRINITY_DN31525_c0_g1_i3:73-2937(-)